MPQTVSGTLLGTFQSIARAVMACSAGPTSLDQITVAHQLGVCPDIMQAILRSSVVNTSGLAAPLSLQSWNASQAVFLMAAPNGAGASQAQYDLVCQLIHSISR